MMKSSFRLLAALILVTSALFAGACDSTEDPRLLNPPTPDSTLVRVVNLSEGEPIYVSVAGRAIAADIAPLGASPYTPVYFAQRVNIFVTRGARTDTLADQVLLPGVRVTIFVASRGNQTRIVPLQAGRIELQDLQTNRQAKATFINALPDSGFALVRSGCQSGAEFFRNVAFGGTSTYIDIPVDLSLYLFAGTQPNLRASARLPLESGTITWVAAASTGGVAHLYAIAPSDVTLRELPAEERSEASVSVLNALSTSTTIDARLGDVPVASGLDALRMSASATVEACRSTTGDSLMVSAGGGELAVPLRMDVGSRALAVVYGPASSPSALSLRLDPPPGVADRAYVRLVNVSTTGSGATLQIGDGAPDSLALATGFPALATGGVSGYVKLTPGAYPLLLLESGTGRHLAGGIQDLAAGYHTILIVDRDGGTDLLVLDHDANSAELGDIDQPGSRARLFNLMSDGSATFSFGAIHIDGLAYSYTATTAIPKTVSTISSTIGDIPVDHSTGSLVIGLTGSGSNRRAISFASPAGSPAEGRAAIRILDAVPEADELTVEFDSTVTARFGEPTETALRNEGRYSFTVRAPGSETVLARITGVELRGGRRYLLVIGPRLPGDQSTERYRALLVQE
jgi:hypothetical protein